MHLLVHLLMMHRWGSFPHLFPSTSVYHLQTELRILTLSFLAQNYCNPKENTVIMATGMEKDTDKLAESLNDLFLSVSAMVKGELQGTNNLLELVEKMNTRVAEEYKGYGDLASGLRVFMDQLKSKAGNFDEYVQQIDSIENQVTEFEAVISMLDKYVSLLESKVQSVYQKPQNPPL